MRGPNPAHEITPAEAAARVGADESYLVVDCRLLEEFEFARIEGSLHIPLHELQERLDEIEDELEDRGLAMEMPFAVLCHHGVRSLRAALLLQQHGFAGARSVYGGIELWSREVDPSIPEYRRLGSRVFPR